MAEQSARPQLLRRPDHVSQIHVPLLVEGAGDEWDAVAYAPDTYDSFQWELEKAVLIPLVKRLSEHQPVKYLDFACGTGRVLMAVEPWVAEAHGVDVSSEMVRVAARKSDRVSIRLADLLVTPEAADSDYDLITVFRFFQNATPGVRLP